MILAVAPCNFSWAILAFVTLALYLVKMSTALSLKWDLFDMSNTHCVLHRDEQLTPY